MIKSGCLKELLKSENLDRTDEVYLKYYKDFNPNKCCGHDKSQEAESMPVIQKEKSALT